MDKGTVLLVTLWMLAILSLLAIGIGFRSTIDLRLVSYQIDSLKAYEIAKAGIIQAINELENDESETDTLWECGVTLEEDEQFDEKFKGVKVGEGHFDIYLEDQERKINLNTAPKAVLMQLLYGAANAGELADSIRAWRGDKGNDQPLPTFRDYSGKDYTCKGAPFDITAELLLVKDITPEIYDGIAGAPGLKELVTPYKPKDLKMDANTKEFKINVNTADQAVLEAVLAAYGFDRLSAANIVEHRKGVDADINKTMDNNTFSNMTELQSFLNPAEGEEPDATGLTNVIASRSSYFKIRSVGSLEGRKSGISKTITCVVKRDASTSLPRKTEIVSWSEE